MAAPADATARTSIYDALALEYGVAGAPRRWAAYQRAMEGYLYHRGDRSELAAAVADSLGAAAPLHGALVASILSAAGAGKPEAAAETAAPGQGEGAAPEEEAAQHDFADVWASVPRRRKRQREDAEAESDAHAMDRAAEDAEAESDADAMDGAAERAADVALSALPATRLPGARAVAPVLTLAAAEAGLAEVSADAVHVATRATSLFIRRVLQREDLSRAGLAACLEAGGVGSL